VIIYKLPRLSREEIQIMLQVQDIRETRLYQEANEEGITEERERSLQDKLCSISKMAAAKIPAADIAAFLGLDVEVVQREIAENHS
jgi:predicted transposase YdaD